MDVRPGLRPRLGPWIRGGARKGTNRLKRLIQGRQSIDGRFTHYLEVGFAPPRNFS